jgi:hypothetical protein
MASMTMYQVELKFGRKWRDESLHQDCGDATAAARVLRDMWRADDARVREIVRHFDEQFRLTADDTKLKIVGYA